MPELDTPMDRSAETLEHDLPLFFDQEVPPANRRLHVIRDQDLVAGGEVRDDFVGAHVLEARPQHHLDVVGSAKRADHRFHDAVGQAVGVPTEHRSGSTRASRSSVAICMRARTGT